MRKNSKNVAGANEFVRDVVAGRNVKAKDILERMLKLKVARRIKETLAS